MIDYSDLQQRLLKLESSIACSPATGFPAAGCVRTTLAPVQGFALDRETAGQELPVIVLLGVNYTQNQQRCPRDLAGGHAAVEDDLKSCRTHLNEALKAVGAKWVSFDKASSVKLQVPEEYHLVMTNFCLWNTNQRWQKIAATDRADLLSKNPLFAGSPTAAPAWPHIRALTNILAPEVILWVAHGIHSEVFRLFTAMRGPFDIPEWLMTPNLSYRYFHYGRCYPR